MKPMMLALAFITLHGPTGKRIDINGESITSLREATAVSEGHLVKGVHCVVFADGGGGIAVRETCDQVRVVLHGTLPSKSPCALVCGDSRR